MVKYVLCLTTVGKKTDAEKIAEKLVGKRLAACVHVMPGVISYYRWKGKLCRDQEWLLVLKTLSTKVKSLQKELDRIHPYELAEFIVLPILKGSAAYLKWLEKEVRN